MLVSALGGVGSAEPEPAPAPAPTPEGRALPAGTWTMQQIAGQPGQSHQASGFAMSTDADGYGQAAVYGQGPSDGSGFVTIYSQAPSNGTQWDVQATLTNASATSKGTDEWGSSVALGGGFLAVGDQQYDKGALRNPVGQVDVFQQDSAGLWSYVQSLKVRGNHNFGASLAIASDCDPTTHCWLVVGAPGADLDVGVQELDEYVAVYDLASVVPGSGSPLDWTAVWKARDWGQIPDSGLGSTVAVGGNWLFASAANQDVLCAAWFDGTVWHSQQCQNPPNYVAEEYEFTGDLPYGASLSVAYEADPNPQLFVGFPDNSYQQCLDSQGVMVSCSSGSNAGGSWVKTDLPGEVVVIDLPTDSQMSQSNCDQAASTCFVKLSSLGTISPPSELGTAKGTNFGGGVAVDPEGVLAIIGVDQAGVSPGDGTAYAYGAKPPARQWELVGELPPGQYQSSGAHYGNPVAMIDQDRLGRIAVGIAAPAQSSPSGAGDFGYAYMWDLVDVANLRLEIRQVDPPAPLRVAEGSSAVYEVTVTNTGGTTANDLQLVAGDPSPPFATTGIELADPSDNPFWTCTTTCSATQLVAGGEQTLRVTMDTSGATQGQTYSVPVVVTWSNPLWGTATASTLTTVDGEVDDPSNMAVTVDLAGGSDVKFVGPGQTGSFVVTATNDDSTVAASAPRLVVSTDLAGAGLSEQSIPQGWACNPASGAAQPTMVCAGPAALAPGATVSATFGVTVPDPLDAPLGASFTTTAAIDWDNPIGSTSTASAEVGTWPPIDVFDFAASADGASMTWLNTSAGDIDSLQMQIVQGIDANYEPVQFYIYEPFNTPCNTFGSPDSCTMDVPLASGDSVTTTMSYSLDNSSDCTVSLVANASWDGGPLSSQPTWTSMGSEPVTVSVAGCGAAVVSASDIGGDPRPGGRTRVRAVVANVGQTPVTDPVLGLSSSGPVVIDAVEDPSTGGPVSSTEWSCVDGAPTTCTGPDLAVGEVREVDLVIVAAADAPTGAAAAVDVDLTTGDTDPDPTDNRASVGFAIADDGGVARGGAGSGGRSGGARSLPTTGSDSSGAVRLALFALAAGASLTLVARRLRLSRR